MNHSKRVIELLRNKGATELCKGIGRFLRSSQRNILNELKSKKQYYEYWWKYGEAAPHPYRILQVDPNKVEYVIVPSFYSEEFRYGTHIKDGDWDKIEYKDEYGPKTVLTSRKIVKLDNYVQYQSFVQHFEYGVPWEETKYFYQAVSGYSNTTRLGNLESPRWEKLQEWDDLYEDIKKSGYKKQRNLGKHPRKEVRVNIGRDGRFILDDGRHRLMIARILGLKTVPMRVFVRHSKWQKYRNSIVKCDKKVGCIENGNTLSHPDIHDLTIDQ